VGTWYPDFLPFGVHRLKQTEGYRLLKAATRQALLEEAQASQDPAAALHRRLRQAAFREHVVSAHCLHALLVLAWRHSTWHCM
jgi:hypothetical protein